MNILKKLFAVALVVLMLPIQGVAVVNADPMPRGLIEGSIQGSTEVILDMKGGEKILEKLDLIIAAIKDDKSKMELVQKRLDTVSNKYGLNGIDGIKNIEKYKNIHAIISYLDLHLEMQLAGKEIEIPEVSWKDEYKKYSQVLSSNENAKINERIIKIQKQLLNTGVESLEELIGEFSEYMNYEEKGDFLAKLDIDHALIGKIQAELELEDYVAKNSDFDTQFTSKIKALLDAAPAGQEAMKLELSGLIDFISKDQNFYVLLQNLQITDEQGVEDMKDFLDKAKEIAATNKYVHFEDEQGAYFIQILQQLTPQNILAAGNEMLSEPLFRAYAKEGNKYSLIPTKYACDVVKELANKFDPFNGSECSEGQYQNLLEDMSESGGVFYMEIGITDTTLGFDSKNIDRDIEYLGGHIKFTDTQITEISAKVVPHQEEFAGEGAELSYRIYGHLDASLSADSGEVEMKLSSTLDKNNRVEELLMTVKGDNNFTAELTIQDNKISGGYKLEEYTTVMLGKVTGATDKSNILEKIQITHQIVESNEYSPFEMNTEFLYDEGSIVFSNIFENEGTQFTLGADAKWDGSNESLDNGNFEMSIKTKDGEYNYDTYEYEYTGEFQEVFLSEMKLESGGNILGKTLVNFGEEETVTIDHSGKYQTDYLKLLNNIKISTLGMPIGTGENAEGNVNITIDMRKSTNDAMLFIDMHTGDKKILEFELSNEGERIYKDVEINAPAESQTQMLEELLDIPQY